MLRDESACEWAMVPMSNAFYLKRKEWYLINREALI
jgi:hypothetical protein